MSPTVRPRLRLDVTDAAAPVQLDPAASAVLTETRTPGAPNLLVLGAPGSGRTSLAVEAVVAAASTGRRVVLLTPARRVAARLRDTVARRLGAHDDAVQVATPAAFAFGLLGQHAAYWGGPQPALLSGPDEDGILAELLAAHATGEVPGPGWPASVPAEALELDAFRHELRDVLARAGELDLEPDDLRRLAREHGRPEWAAVGAVLQQHRDALEVQDAADEVAPTAGVGAPRRGHRRYDSARIVDEAAAVLNSWHLPPSTVPADPQDVPTTPTWDLVVVDDYQDVTRSTARLLRVLVRDGARLLLLGDPDVAVQTFRGGSPTLVAESTAEFGKGGFGTEVRVLPQVHRGTPALRAAVASLTERLPAGGQGIARRRASVPGRQLGDGPPVEVRTFRSAAQEADAIADAIRHAHLVDGLPYRQCAVIVRTSGQASAVRSLLGARRIPVSPGRIGTLRDEPAVRPLLAVVRAAAGGAGGEWRGAGGGTPGAAPDPRGPAGAMPDATGEVPGATGEVLRDLMLSPLGGADAVRLRRLMRALRGASEVAGGPIDSDRVVETALASVVANGADALPPGIPAVLTEPLVRIAAVLRATTAALAEDDAPRAVLWAAWDATGLAATWQGRAVDGGPGAARAHADLDAVLALFYAAERYETRGLPGGALAFVERIEAQRVAEDTLAAQSGRRDVVEVLTAAQAAGQEWDLVAVAGLQEDVWPDLRRRDTILGSQGLVDVVTGRGDGNDRWTEARREVRDDELRQLVLAASRATRQLMVTAVEGGDALPSLFHELMHADAAAFQTRPTSDGRTSGSVPAGAAVTGATSGQGREPGGRATRPADVASRQVVRDLRMLVAELRRALAADPADADAARVLARLAVEGVDGADPARWVLAHEPSTHQPLRAGTEPVGVSPSAVEQANQCALRWALGRFGGTGGDSSAQALGTVIHAIAERHPAGTPDELRAALEEELQALDLGVGLAADKERARAERLVDKLAGYLATPVEVDVEEEVDVIVGDAHVRGRIDRLEHLDDGTVRIVDLKTGRQISAAEAEENPQLAVYQVALREKHEAGEGPAPAGARLVYLGTDNVKAAQREQPALPDETDTWAHTMLSEAVRAMSGDRLTARTNPMCQHCQVRTSCPVQPDGRRIGTTEETA